MFILQQSLIEYIRQDQPEVPSDQTNEGQSEYGRQKKSHVCERTPMELPKSEPNATQPMDGPGPRPTLMWTIII